MKDPTPSRPIMDDIQQGTRSIEEVYKLIGRQKKNYQITKEKTGI